jgi:type IV pilus assembly protein PilW
MTKTPTQKRQSGLTMIELLVALTISLFMLSAIMIAYTTSKSGFAYANNTIKISEDASFALEMIGRDVRMAGYAGCTGSNVVSNAGPPAVDFYTPKLDLVDSQVVAGTAKPNPFSGVVAGNLTQLFTSQNAIWGFPANNTAALSVLGGSATTYSKSTTDPILYLAGGSTQAIQLSNAIATATDDATIPADTYKWGNNTNPTFLIIADCKGSEVFRASSLAGAGPVTIAHAATDNDSASFSNTYGADAIVTPLMTSVYFIATRSGANTPSLYVRQFDGSVATVQELVPNVQAIAFNYGVNTSNTPGGEPTYRTDEYKTDPSTVADWSRVVSVRVGLLMVSDDDSQAEAAGSSVSWLGGTYTPASTDRRLRRAYSTTISIRNRMGL